MFGGLIDIQSDVTWAIYTKILILAKASLFASPSLCIAGVILLRGSGLADLVVEVTQLNRCFIVFVISRYIALAIAVYGIHAKSLYDPTWFKYQVWNISVGLFTSMLMGRYAFPSLCSRRFVLINDRQVEASPLLIEKAAIFCIMVLIAMVVDTTKRMFLVSRSLPPPVSTGSVDGNSNVPTDEPSSEAPHSRRSIIQHIIWSFKDAIPGVTTQHLLFGMIFFSIFIVSNEAHEDPYMSIFIFGYLFPALKYVIIWITSKHAIHICDAQGHTEMRRASLIASLTSAATICCTFSQMYTIALNSHDFFLFCMEVHRSRFVF